MRKQCGGWRAAVSAAVFLLLTVAGILIYTRLYRVEPVFSEMDCEFGESLSRDIEDYLMGTEWSVGLGQLDLSRVDETHTGTYQAVVYHGRQQYVYQIHIRDTVAPEIVFCKEQVYLAAGRDCVVGDVIEAVVDADARTEGYFIRDGQLLSDIRFERVGSYELEVAVRDSSGNESRGRVDVIVDTPPVIEGVHNFYLTVDSSPDYLEEITARDDVDGSLTERIRVDASEVRLDVEGNYVLRYLAVDSFGLETCAEADVMVASAEEIQSLIGRRKINYRVDTILGAPNIYDAGAAAVDDLDATLEYMRPALVQLYHATGRGGYSSGSGYIMEITEDTVYICTNRHVVEKNEDWDIYLFDGTAVKGKKLGVCDDYDVGVATVAVQDIPAGLLEQLMTVHIDKNYWESLDEQPIELALERVDREGGLVHTTEGNLIKIRQEFEWYDKLDHTEVTVELVHGDSGSAVLDGYGNLICMAYAYSTSPVRYWCVPLDAILDCYHEITGRMPYVYGDGISTKLP